MKVEELRIGNLLRDKVSKTELKVVELTENDIITYVIDREMFPLKDGWGIEPIPLTEEWLVKFGFNKRFFGENLSHYFANTNKIWKIVFNKGVFKRDGLEIKHVHQLQNLYFALTGKELTIKK